MNLLHILEISQPDPTNMSFLLAETYCITPNSLQFMIATSYDQLRDLATVVKTNKTEI